MISSFDISNIEDTKSLYFLIGNSFGLYNPPTSLVNKLSGLYAIYKDGVCFYVGQSQNIASRLATHISGKYKNADEIKVWDICYLGFSDFHERSSKSKKIILENNELFLIRNLCPIENIIVNDDAIEPCFLHHDHKLYLPKYCDLSVYLEDRFITITDDFYQAIASLPPSEMNSWNEDVISIDNYLNRCDHEIQD